jgi:acylphosphatase
METVRIIVTGFVQGVGFRYFVLKRALELGVKGYARNLTSGEVEVVAEADRSRLNEFIELIKEGPRHAEVRSAVSEPFPSHHFEDFSIR